MRNPPLFAVGRTKLEVIRRGPKVFTRGRWEDGEQSVVEIICNVQPILKSSDTLLLPEGDRSKACLKVYTDGSCMLALREAKEGHDADRFYWQGDLYEVMKVINYAMGVLDHHKAICMRVELT